MKRMKWSSFVWGVVILLVTGILGSGCRENGKQQTQDAAKETPQRAALQDAAGLAPDFSGTTLDGDAIKLSDYQGKVVVIDFWATWCPPCREAIPQLSTLAEKYEGKDVVVLGASSESLEKVESFWFKHQPAYTAIIVDESVFRSYGVRGIPTLCIVDQKGAIRYQEAGFRPDMKVKLAEVIDRLLEG